MLFGFEGGGGKGRGRTGASEGVECLSRPSRAPPGPSSLSTMIRKMRGSWLCAGMRAEWNRAVSNFLPSIPRPPRNPFRGGPRCSVSAPPCLPPRAARARSTSPLRGRRLHHRRDPAAHQRRQAGHRAGNHVRVLCGRKFRAAGNPLREGRPGFRRQIVVDPTGEAPGTIVVHLQERHLYLVQPGGDALRYGVGIGRDGFIWSGRANIQYGKKWPTWTPPPK